MLRRAAPERPRRDVRRCACWSARARRMCRRDCHRGRRLRSRLRPDIIASLPLPALAPISARQSDHSQCDCARPIYTVSAGRCGLVCARLGFARLGTRTMIPSAARPRVSRLPRAYTRLAFGGVRGGCAPCVRCAGYCDRKRAFIRAPARLGPELAPGARCRRGGFGWLDDVACARHGCHERGACATACKMTRVSGGGAAEANTCVRGRGGDEDGSTLRVWTREPLASKRVSIHLAFEKSAQREGRALQPRACTADTRLGRAARLRTEPCRSTTCNVTGDLSHETLNFRVT
jgi:hypothetical protein